MIVDVLVHPLDRFFIDDTVRIGDCRQEGLRRNVEAHIGLRPPDRGINDAGKGQMRRTPQFRVIGLSVVIRRQDLHYRRQRPDGRIAEICKLLRPAEHVFHTLT